jgi:hypothetical protein
VRLVVRMLVRECCAQPYEREMNPRFRGAEGNVFALGDLAGAETPGARQHHRAALLIGEPAQRGAQRARAVRRFERVARQSCGGQRGEVVRIGGDVFADPRVVDGEIACDGRQPGDDAAPARVEALGAPPHAQQHFLGDVFGGA